MSWYRQIKSFYTVSINMFFFIIWGIISSIFLMNMVDYRLYFVSLASAFLLQFLKAKMKGEKLSFFVSILAGILLTFAISRGVYLILNGGFIVFILYLTNKMEYEDVSYDVYKGRARNGLSFILILGVFLPFIDMSLSKSILKFYVMFLVSNIVVLREARSYFYKIRNTKNFIANVLISVFILVLSVDVFFSKVLDIFKYVMDIVLRVAGEIAYFIGLLVSKPLMFGISKLRVLVEKSLEERIKPEQVKVPDWMKEQVQLVELESLEWLIGFIKIVAIIIILVAIILVVVKAVGLRENKNTALEEYREKINRETAKKDSFINRFIRSLLKPTDLRGQILYLYKRFQEKTFNKGIFKKHMTASQLENVTKAYVENTDGLRTLTNIYNEAKFSNHEVTEQELKMIKEDYNKVKKQL